LSNEADQLTKKKESDGRYIAARFSVCPLSLIDCQSKRDFDRTSSSAQMEGNIWIDGRKWILGTGTVSLEPTNSAAMQCTEKALTIMCCHWRPREANTFHVLHMAALSIFKVDFWLKQFLEKKLIKKGDFVIDAESYISFAKMSILKRSVRCFSRLWCRQKTLLI